LNISTKKIHTQRGGLTQGPPKCAPGHTQWLSFGGFSVLLSSPPAS